MTMNAVVVASDVVTTIAFLVAGVLALTIDLHSPLVSRTVRNVFAAAMGLYVFVGMSNVLEHAGVTAAFDVYEDFAEILFVPAIAYVTSTMLHNRQLAEREQAARLVQQQNDLLLSIVDTVPGGVVVVGPTGAVTFANEGAERLLGMSSDTGGSVSITPSWTLVDPLTGTKTTLSELASGAEVSRKSFIAQWPDGAQTELILSVTPMAARGGELGGSIIGFESSGQHV